MQSQRRDLLKQGGALAALLACGPLAMRDALLQRIRDAMADDPRLFFVCADFGSPVLDSIRERLWPMGNDTVFIPGHGPESTFGDERRTNPHVRDRA